MLSPGFISASSFQKMRRADLLPTSLLIIGIVTVFIFAMYLVTLAPGLSWANAGADGGDYLSALHTGGIPHPTGYPTYLLLVKLIYLIPFGSLALRGNLFSAISMSLASAFLFASLWHLTPPTWQGKIAALFGSLFFAFSPLVWSQAVITEVYGLHALFLAVFFYTMVAGKLHEPKDFFFLGILLGLGLGNHATFAILLVPFLIIQHKQRWGRWEGKELGENALSRLIKRYSIASKLFGLLLGLSVYGTLFFYAQTRSPVRWLNPTSLDRFWQLISGQMYHFYWGLPSDQSIMGKAFVVIETVFNQLGWLGLLLLVAGLIALVREKSGIRNISLWLFLVSFFFALGYQAPDALNYLIPAIFCLAIWIAYGISFVVSHLKHRSVQHLFLILVGGFLAFHSYGSYISADASRDFRAIEYGQSVMQEAPEGAMIFTKDDNETFALWYFLYVENLRPDISIIVTPFLRYEWYREVLTETYTDLVIPVSGSINRETIEEVNQRSSCSTSALSATPLVCR